MKSELSHLPQNKQDELKLINEKIREQAPVEMIILYGSYARGDYKEQKDLAPDRKSGHVSDYDILVVTAEKETASDSSLWQNITKQCDALNLSTHVRIITHDIEFVNKQLSEDQFFFSDIQKEGIMLYDSGGFELASKQKLEPSEKQRIAQNHFDHWFGDATSSFRVYEQCIKINEYKKAAFNLHQVTEACYKAIILVFTNYNPNEHYLMNLEHAAGKHDRFLRGIFQKETEEQRELFNLLDYAYIGARYDPDYKITKEQLEYLAERVEELQKLTNRVCNKKIKSLA